MAASTIASVSATTVIATSPSFLFSKAAILAVTIGWLVFDALAVAIVVVVVVVVVVVGKF